MNKFLVLPFYIVPENAVAFSFSSLQIRAVEDDANLELFIADAWENLLQSVDSTDVLFKSESEKLQLYEQIRQGITQSTMQIRQIPKDRLGVLADSATGFCGFYQGSSEVTRDQVSYTRSHLKLPPDLCFPKLPPSNFLCISMIG